MDTIIFVPGHGCTARVFAAQLQALSEHYKCVCIDLRDYISLEEVIEDIIQQAPEKFYMLGFSLGAIIGLHVTQKIPERIKGLIHISAPYEGPSAALIEDLAHVQEILPNMSMTDFTLLAYQKYFPDRKLDDPLYTVLTQMLTATGKTHYLAQAKMLLTPWSLVPAAHNNHPVLILGGAIDHRAKPEYHLTMAEQLPTATVHLLPNTRHFVTLEQPELSSNIIREWLVNLKA